MLAAVKVFILEQIGASKSFFSECEALQNIRGQLALGFSFILLANKAPAATRQHKGDVFSYGVVLLEMLIEDCNNIRSY